MICLHKIPKQKNSISKGRKDSQIKVMGHRIELSEIEVSMNKIHLIDEVVIFSKKYNIQIGLSL